MKDAAELMERVNFFLHNRLPMVYQSEASECGLACLAMVAGFHGFQTDIIELRRAYPVSLNGSNLIGLLHTAEKMGLQGRPVRAELTALRKLKKPCILHWKMNHFVVLKKVLGNKIVVHDPAKGVQTYTLEQASPLFSGVALELYSSDFFVKKKAPRKMKLTDLWSGTLGLKKALFYTFLLSIIIQIFALAAPFYMQIVVDEVIPKYEENLLFVVAIGFSILMLINIVTSLMRSILMLFVGSSLNIQMTRNLFHHLLYLPMQWFEKRHMGDILSRFSSMQPIGKLFSEGIVAAVIDGFMAITTGVIMFVYSPKLAFIVIIAIILFSIVRFSLFTLIKSREQSALLSGANEETAFIESVRAIQTIKIFGREHEREALWLNSLINKFNSQINVSRILIFFTSFQSVLFGIENILVVYVGATMIFENMFSVGMLFAFMAFKRQFTENIVTLLERVFDYRMLSLHLERIADISFEKPEVDLDRMLDADENNLSRQKSISNSISSFSGKIEFKDVWFRYGDSAPWILKGATFVAEPGEMVVITGSSGEGKTTLLKLVLGLIIPERGQILIDDTPMQSLEIRQYRRAFGTVMQQDSLMSGSISENIAFFDHNLDFSKVRMSASQASIAEEIDGLPMKYDTLIGHMGSSLSGGQQQRLLLARALYNEPTFLVMDEGTANLDADNEQKVLQNIKSLNVTRITVAHKEAVIRSADRLLVMKNGRLQLQSNPINERKLRTCEL